MAIDTVDSSHRRRLRGARLTVLAASLVAFLVSANIAWLNPAPDFEVYRTGPLPVLWQYNPDAGVELVSAAWFPDAFRTYPERIGRPGYPAIVNAISLGLEVIAAPVRPLSRLEASGIAYATVKLLSVIVAGQAALAVLRRRLPIEAAVLGSVLVLLHWHVLENAAAFHTTDLQMTGTVLVLWIAFRVEEREARRASGGTMAPRRLAIDAFLAGSTVGVLLLVKATLVAPLAILTVLLLRARFLVAGLATLGALWPQLAYQAFLRSQQIEYVNWEVQEYRQGVWILDALREPAMLAAESLEILASVLPNAVAFYGPLLLLAMVAFGTSDRRLLMRTDATFVLLALGAALMQYLAVRRETPYMTGDLGIVIAGAAAASLVRLRAWSSARVRGAARQLEWLFGTTGFLLAVSATWLAYGMTTLANFPLVPPWEQLTRNSEVLENRIDILENPDRYSDVARERARGGVIVAPDED